jgi:hypothetical protein
LTAASTCLSCSSSSSSSSSRSPRSGVSTVLRWFPSPFCAPVGQHNARCQREHASGVLAYVTNSNTAVAATELRCSSARSCPRGRQDNDSPPSASNVGFCCCSCGSTVMYSLSRSPEDQVRRTRHQQPQTTVTASERTADERSGSQRCDLQTGVCAPAQRAQAAPDTTPAPANHPTLLSITPTLPDRQEQQTHPALPRERKKRTGDHATLQPLRLGSDTSHRQSYEPLMGLLFSSSLDI